MGKHRPKTWKNVLSSLFISYNITNSWLNPFNGFCFFFLYNLCDSENDYVVGKRKIGESSQKASSEQGRISILVPRGCGSIVQQTNDNHWTSLQSFCTESRVKQLKSDWMKVESDFFCMLEKVMLESLPDRSAILVQTNPTSHHSKCLVSTHH